jgi:hypothetical protein
MFVTVKGKCPTYAITNIIINGFEKHVGYDTKKVWAN